ncbi:MAG: 50S ribosomal protein L3 [Candidatus Paceibacterota bacterium]|jgi:large subunit ribosomal protein L3
MKFMLGKKEYMTQLFDESGKVIPGTVVSAGPLIVARMKKDRAIVGYGERKLKNIAKPQHQFAEVLEKEGFGFETLKEFSTEETYNPGDKIDVSIFTAGDIITVSAISKGKGFQGVVKRHGFKGGRRSHGQKHSEREAGAIGAGGIQRVLKGLRMAGRMGGERVTLKNLTIAKINKDENLIFIKGAIPGRKGTLVEIKSS